MHSTISNETRNESTDSRRMQMERTEARARKANRNIPRRNYEKIFRRNFSIVTGVRISCRRRINRSEFSAVINSFTRKYFSHLD